MTEETPTPESGYRPSQVELLETLFLITLEENDGLCLDNEEERRQLAAILVSTLITAQRGEVIDLALLLVGLDQSQPPPQPVKPF